MTEINRRILKKQLNELLLYWRQIEAWLKRAEIITFEARVPAINEMRYAARQLFNGFRIYGKYKLSPGDKSALNKRIIIAEQYFLNADHDICDAILGHFSLAIADAEKKASTENIHKHFNDYHNLKKIKDEAYELVQLSREDYFKRKESYEALRKNYIPKLLEYHDGLLQGAASAIFEERSNQTTYERALLKAKILSWFSIVTGVASLVSIPMAAYLWFTPPQELCLKIENSVFKLACTYAGHKTEQ